MHCDDKYASRRHKGKRDVVRNIQTQNKLILYLYNVQGTYTNTMIT